MTRFGGTPIVLTAPLTETIDHAGYFIQMSMASLPIWLEGILNRKYPQWRNVEYNDDGTARCKPAGALLDLHGSIVDTPGVEQHVLSHATIAPAVVDPVLIRDLSEKLLDKSGPRRRGAWAPSDCGPGSCVS